LQRDSAGGARPKCDVRARRAIRGGAPNASADERAPSQAAAGENGVRGDVSYS